MHRVVTFTLALAFGAMALVLIAGSSPGGSAREATKLALTTDYLFESVYLGKTSSATLGGSYDFSEWVAGSKVPECGGWRQRLWALKQPLWDVKQPLWGHWLRLNVTLDDKGGKGQLEIDPSIQRHNEFGDPTVVTHWYTWSVDITVEAAKLDDPTKKGRRVYEIKGKELETRLFLVVSRKGAGPHRLIVHGKERVSVFPLEEAGTDR